MFRLARRPLLRFAPRLFLAFVGMSAIAVADGSGGGALRAIPGFANDAEGSLVRAIVGLRERGMKQAMVEIDSLLDRNPNYRLGHMVKGDMLMARAGKPMAFAALGSANASVAPLQDEAELVQLPQEPFILYVGAFRKVKGLETLFATADFPMELYGELFTTDELRRAKGMTVDAMAEEALAAKYAV